MEGRAWNEAARDDKGSCFVLLVHPHYNSPNRASATGWSSQHLHTLYGDGGIFPVSSRRPRKLRAGAQFYLYCRHDLDVVRVSAVAGGLYQACILKDVLPCSDVHLCVVDERGEKVEQHCVCRATGPYQRLEDEGLEALSKWSALSGKQADADRIPRRRQPFRIKAEGAAGHMLPAVDDFASRMLAPTVPRVPYGILFRLPAQSLPCDELCQERISALPRFRQEPQPPACSPLDPKVKPEVLEQSLEQSATAVEVLPGPCAAVEAPSVDSCVEQMQLRSRHSSIHRSCSEGTRGTHPLIGSRIQRFFPSAGLCEGAILKGVFWRSLRL